MGLDGISQVELSHEYDDLGRWEYLVNDNVIAAPTPYSDKQLFRIYNRMKGDDEVTVYARHIYYSVSCVRGVDRCNLWDCENQA